MDQTLTQLIQNLINLSQEVARLEAENARLRHIIDSNLPVVDGTIADLAQGEVVKVEQPL